MRGGFTLLEMLLAGILFVVLGLVMVQTLVPVMRYGSWGYARAELVQATARISGRLVADLQTAPFEAITVGPGVVSLHGIAGVTDSGQPLYSDHLVLYRWDSAAGDLDRLEWSDDVSQDAPSVLDPSRVGPCFASGRGARRGLARGLVKEFSLTGASQPLQLHLVTVLAVPGRDPERLVHDQTLYLRNGR